MEAICWKNDRKKFLLWMLLTVQSQQWQSADAWRRTDMEQELRKKEKNITKQYWDMVSLLVAVLNHNNLVETEHQDDISFYMEQVYRQLQKNYPEYGITEEEIENVSHLAPIHDIGKIRVSIEILNKNGKLTIDEMEVVKQHPICRKKKKTWYDSKTAC